MVTVEADLDGVERRLAAGELWCPSCSNRCWRGGGGRGRGRSAAGRAGAVVSAPVVVHRLRVTHVLLPVNPSANGAASSSPPSSSAPPCNGNATTPARKGQIGRQKIFDGILDRLDTDAS